MVVILIGFQRSAFGARAFGVSGVDKSARLLMGGIVKKQWCRYLSILRFLLIPKMKVSRPARIEKLPAASRRQVQSFRGRAEAERKNILYKFNTYIGV